MIIKSDELKQVCSKILSAVDSNELSVLTETLQLATEDNNLILSVTNREYFVEVKLPITCSENFYATVNANLFLKLISQITTSDIELTVDSTSLNVTGNGKYKLPLIFDNDQLLQLPEILINNPMKTFSISSDILMSILQYNSKELLKGTISRPVQKLYYIDEQGAITFTSGACVNNFTLPECTKFLLNDRLVKLFKLFQNSDVNITIGYDPISDSIIQTKIKFENNMIKLTAILSCDETMLNSVPVAAIRGRANNIYPYSVNIDKNALLQTINRLLLFNTNGTKGNLKPYSIFEFNHDNVRIWDVAKINNEVISYNNSNIDDNYCATLDLIDLKMTLETCSEQYLTLNFGDSQAVVLARGNIKNIIPEVRSI